MMTDHPNTALHFDYFDDWRTAELHCPRCGWTGTFEQGLVELHTEVQDSSCPNCVDLILAIVAHPTLGEMGDHLDELPEAERRRYERVVKFNQRFEREKLKSPEQLSLLEGERLHLLWDFEAAEGSRTVIRHGDTVVWSEPAVWEGYWRFEEVLDVLVQKYGSRLVDLEPTRASQLYLLGDSFSAAKKVHGWRRALPHAWQPGMKPTS